MASENKVKPVAGKNETTENPAEIEKPQVLFEGVTQEELDEWKEKYKEVHIITVKVSDSESITGYFKKPDRNVMANVVNMANNGNMFGAREFLLNNTYIGGNKRITTDFDASIVAQTKLYAGLNFLTAEAVKY